MERVSDERRYSGSVAGVIWWAVFAGLVWVFINWLVLASQTKAVVDSGIAVVFTLFGAFVGAKGWLGSKSKRDEALDKAKHEANHDPLTKLPNRAALMTELELSLEDTRFQEMVLGVLFLDLDRFKIVNDSMGHEAGDRLLKIVAERLKASVRSTDVVARFGGDEFVVICRGLLSTDSVVSVAKQIIKNFSEPVTLNSRSQLISTSIGVTIFDSKDDRTPADLVRDADTAMFSAKRNKSGYAIFDETQHKHNVNRLEVERGLTAALQENQFAVFYQPIVDLHNGGLYAFEALVRWNHPDRGILTPGDFLNVAEEAGMLAKIGDIVLREACAQAAVWNHASPEAQKVKMSVNLAEQQILDPNLQFHIADVLSWSGIEPSQLILEITEDVIVEHLDGLDSLRYLSELGVSLAIDDFGTGQSSLHSIKQLDMVSTLKVASKFVRDMNSSDADRAIIEAIVAMAAALEMNIIAEGVETEEQIVGLRKLGVDNMQGFFFSKPQAAGTINPQEWFEALKSVRGPA